MREIKFRAWDAKDEVMVAFGHSDFSVVSERVRNYALGYDSEGNYRRQDNTTYMQYTGLKDKDGVEIYEGDIVDVVATHHDFGVGVIEWNKQEVRFGVKLDTDTCYIIDGGLDELKVIGNIYENPEQVEEEL